MIYDLSRIMTTITMLQCTMKTQARSQKPRRNLKGDQKQKRNKKEQKTEWRRDEEKIDKESKETIFPLIFAFEQT